MIIYHRSLALVESETLNLIWIGTSRITLKFVTFILSMSRSLAVVTKMTRPIHRGIVTIRGLIFSKFCVALYIDMKGSWFNDKLIWRPHFPLLLILNWQRKCLCQWRKKVHHEYTPSYHCIHLIKIHEKLDQPPVLLNLVHILLGTTSTLETTLYFHTQIVQLLPKFLHLSVVICDVKGFMSQVVIPFWIWYNLAPPIYS